MAMYEVIIPYVGGTFISSKKGAIKQAKTVGQKFFYERDLTIPTAHLWDAPIKCVWVLEGVKWVSKQMDELQCSCGHCDDDFLPFEDDSSNDEDSHVFDELEPLTDELCNELVKSGKYTASQLDEIRGHKQDFAYNRARDSFMFREL